MQSFDVLSQIPNATMPNSPPEQGGDSIPLIGFWCTYNFQVTNIGGIKVALPISLRTISSVCMCTVLAGCLGSTGGGGAGGGGGGGGGGGSLSAYETAFNSASQTNQPTQTAITGTASYTGQVKVLTNANAADAKEAIVGDLNMTINFDSNNRPVDATVNNFAGEVNGVQTSVAGSLTTANAPTQINTITASVVNLPVIGPVTTTGLSVGMEGALSDPTGTLTGDALMILQGTFVGANGASVFGSNSVIIDPATGANIITGGTFYSNRN